MDKRYLLVASVIAIITITYLLLTMERRYVPSAEWANESSRIRGEREPLGFPIIPIPIFFGVLLTLLVPLILLYSNMQVERKLSASAELLSKLASDNHNPIRKPKSPSMSRELIARLLDPREMAVIERLIEQPKGILQSEIVKMPGMTKLKAHRVVERLRQKGIITVQRTGKTNQLKLESRTRSIISRLE